MLKTEISGGKSLVIFLINAVKIIFLLGFLVLIHEGGHFLTAKFCKVKVNEFSIGFGPVIWKSKHTTTQYTLRLIPLGGFVSMEGEEERSEAEGSFSKASILKRMMIVLAGGVINVLFGLLVYFGLVILKIDLQSALQYTKEFLFSIFDSLKLLFSGQVGLNQLTGPVGISNIIIHTSGLESYLYMLALISVSLGVTNLLPFPPLDGGKVVLLMIEGIRKKPLKEKIEIQIQMLGFFLLIVLSLFVTYQDITRVM